MTTDAAPGMKPDVVCPAEHLPFAGGSFDVVACRTAAHHFADVGAAVREMARVAAQQVLLVDTVNMGEAVERAERAPRPVARAQLHGSGWRELATAAGLTIEDVEIFLHTFDVQAWLERTGCEGQEAEQVLALLGDRVADGRLTLDKIAIRAVKD